MPAAYLTWLSLKPINIKELIQQLKAEIGPDVSLVLLAAPAAMTYYPKLGFEHIDNAFLQRRPF